MTIPEYLLSVGWKPESIPGQFADPEQQVMVDCSDAVWELYRFDDDGRGRWESTDEMGDTLEELRTALGNLQVKA